MFALLQVWVTAPAWLVQSRWGLGGGDRCTASEKLDLADDHGTCLPCRVPGTVSAASWLAGRSALDAPGLQSRKAGSFVAGQTKRVRLLQRL